MSTRFFIAYFCSGLLVSGCLDAVSCRNNKGSVHHVTPARTHEQPSGALTNETHSDRMLFGFQDLPWQEYFRLNPDLQAQGLSSPKDARTHYRDFGQFEKRLYQLPRIILRYTAATGLTNQHYCHIAAFSLCATLTNCTIVLPPAVARSSFGDKFAVNKSRNKVTWSAEPLETLYDTEQIIQIWHKAGLEVLKTPQRYQLPDLTEPEKAYPRYTEELDQALTTHIPNLYLKALDMHMLVAIVTRAVVLKGQQYMVQANVEHVPYIVVDLPVTLFMIRSSQDLDLASTVARNLPFAPALHKLADKVLAGLAMDSAVFNAAHLRFESDAWEWRMYMGGTESFQNECFEAMQTAGFDRYTPVYLATGLLTYKGGQDVLSSLATDMAQKGFCNGVRYKEQILDNSELGFLHSEQKALVDLLVLTKAQAFVGFEPSTFSFYTSQYRMLLGFKPESSVLVEGAVMSTNPLFEAAAVIAKSLPTLQRPHANSR